MGYATRLLTMLTAFTWQACFFLTACRAGAQAADDTRAPIGTHGASATRLRQALSLLTHSFRRAAYASERASRTQRQRAKPVSFLTITKRRLLDESFRLWRRRHS
jgi:hypothetical protein